MFKCSKSMMAAAVAMAISGFAIAQDTGSSGSGGMGPGKTSGSPVSDRGTDQNQNAAGGARQSGGSSGTSGSATGGSSSSGSSIGGSSSASGSSMGTGSSASSSMTGGGDQSAQIRQFASQPDQASDKLFALDAATGNLWEVEFSRLVEQKAQDQQVKDLARQMRTDHEQANQRLQQSAQALGIQFPTSLPEEKQAKLEVFRAMPADKLEKCYVSALEVDHAKDIVNYQVHQNEIQDQQLKQYVTEVLPKLQQHAQHVQQAAQAKGIQGADISSLARASSSGSGSSGMGMGSSGSSGTGGTASSGSGSSGSSSGSSGTGASGSSSGSGGAGTASRQE